MAYIYHPVLGRQRQGSLVSPPSITSKLQVPEKDLPQKVRWTFSDATCTHSTPYIHAYAHMHTHTQSGREINVKPLIHVMGE